MDEQRQRSLGVITYLAQIRHSSYGRDSFGLLQQSVTALFTHYNRWARDDVIFFHTGVNTSSQQQVLSKCTGVQARFLMLPGHHFRVPPGTPSSSTWRQPKFSAGYRHMIRFYTMGIWEVVRDEGYSFVMRMDEDSVLMSPIRYNVFEYLESRNIDYAYRLASWEHGFHGYDGDSYFGLIRTYVQRHVSSTGWLLDSCPSSTRSIQNYTLRHCGEPYGIYNNFFVARTSFWFRPEVQHFLRFVNRSHTIYTHRFNDILFQSAAIKLFMDPRRLHMFQDFAYEHMTFGTRGRRPRPCKMFGAFTLGTGSRHSSELEPARRRMRVLRALEPCWVMLHPAVYRNGKMAYSPRYNLGRACEILNPTRTDVETLTMGESVSPEQAFCDREPPPYYCRQEVADATGTREGDSTRIDFMCNETRRRPTGGSVRTIRGSNRRSNHKHGV